MSKQLICNIIFMCWIKLSIGDDLVSTMPNSSAPKDGKDLYVVRATVYQVGILTNKTNETLDTTGQQEAITFYHQNGSHINLNRIPSPIITNVTAENVVGTSPVTKNSLPWNLKDFVPATSGAIKTKRAILPVSANITKGAVVIPSEAAVQSIALPPLLALNNNLSHIPVPIPNVSLVSYAKINTLVHQPFGLI